MVADDTAESARGLSEGKLPETAAVVASKYYADLYGLTIIQKDTQDLKNNLTLILGIENFG